MIDNRLRTYLTYFWEDKKKKRSYLILKECFEFIHYKLVSVVDGIFRSHIMTSSQLARYLNIGTALYRRRGQGRNPIQVWNFQVYCITWVQNCDDHGKLVLHSGVKIFLFQLYYTLISITYGLSLTQYQLVGTGWRNTRGWKPTTTTKRNRASEGVRITLPQSAVDSISRPPRFHLALQNGNLDRRFRFNSTRTVFKRSILIGTFCEDQRLNVPRTRHVMTTSTKQLYLSVLSVPEYHTMFLAVWFIEGIHHCVGEIPPLKQEFVVLSECTYWVKVPLPNT